MTGDEILSMIGRIDAELEKSPASMPSKFWRSHAATHIDLLLKYGIENFKRTVAHNYYNWLTLSLKNAQIQMLLLLWRQHGKLDVFTDVMEAPGDAGMPINGHSNPLLDPNIRRVYQMGVSLLWDYTLHTDWAGVLATLEEPLLGNPLRIWRGDRLLSQDLAHSVRERNTICDHVSGPLVIGELGAGHGRLAHVFHKTTDCRYFIFDISPALVVSQWYISNLFPEEKVFKFRPFDEYDDIREELDGCRFAFFSANQLEKMPDDIFNIFINVCSLMEMRLDSIDHFLRQINRVTNGVFYTKQWLEQNNGYDSLVIKKEDYPIPSYWKNLVSRGDPINIRLYEELWKVGN